MDKSLFSEFNSVSSKLWKQKIQFDLKGADYNDTLVWKTNEDISVKPFYHADDFDTLPNISNTKASKWNICQSIFVANVEKSNVKAIDAIERGADNIQFIIPSKDVSIDELLKNIDLDNVTIHLELQCLPEEFTKQMAVNQSKARIHMHCDIINHLVKTGNWFSNIKDDFQQFDYLLKETNSITVDMSLYQNAGATIVQQLAYGLAHINEYLNHSCNLIAKETMSSTRVTFKISMGTNYFFEIAKLRALRILWKTLASEYPINPDCYIFATPSKRNKTIYDYNTNMLRTTTECMSAILGGANTICNLPYDAIYHKSNEFGERIARNQLLILKHESYFDKVDNPCDGAYYIETLTNQLAGKALDLFKNMEANGGFLKQLKEGTIQRKIKESATKEQHQFDSGEEILLGTNKHPNKNDRMKDDLEIYPFVKINKRKTLIEPILERRLAEQMEQKRLKNETN